MRSINELEDSPLIRQIDTFWIFTRLTKLKNVSSCTRKLMFFLFKNSSNLFSRSLNPSLNDYHSVFKIKLHKFYVNFTSSHINTDLSDIKF